LELRSAEEIGAMSKAVSSRLRAAYNRLPTRPGERWRLPGMVNALVLFAGKDQIQVLPKFQSISRGAAKKEIQSFIGKTGALIDQLERMHQPSIVALANRHVLVAELLQTLKTISAAAHAARLGRYKEAGRKG